MTKKKTRITGILIAAVAVVVFLLGYNRFFSGADGGNGNAERVPCLKPGLPIPEEYHIHPHLEIFIDKSRVVVPANIGFGLASCERVLHTHDNTGTIHIEPNFKQDFTLGDFFALWEKPFSENQILDCVSNVAADGNTEIRMTVNNERSEEYERLILKDGQKIMIECGVLDSEEKPRL